MSLPFAYNPPTGVNDTTQFPDSDPNLRVHLQALLDQIKDCLNNDVNSSLASMTNTASLATSGWFKDKKTGLIIQWGVVSTSTSGVAATFPIAFPTSVYGVIPNGISTGSITYYTALTLTGATFWATAGTPSAFYIAIGK